ncbi:MAG: flagellum-specific ATP synthase FliI, partial [Bdellovibrionaceae bacterium]|nr:flagellum-specific ATP synthase FliI [Pseudobdellovibrionaceae bacterium]
AASDVYKRQAQREIGLSTGEPPSTKGYPPSVFSTLPRLLERAGSFSGQGSITGLYTTLVEGDDINDPIGDTVRSIVDGHIVLSRALSQKGHFPAVDILQSASRVMRNVTSESHMNMSFQLRELLATYKEAEDLINIGAYKAGSNPKIDRAVRLIDQINNFLRQRIDEKSTLNEAVGMMGRILSSG